MKQRTLIITGAGSNLGYGFLTGADLRKFLAFEYRDYFLSLYSGASTRGLKEEIERFVKGQIEGFSRVFFNSHVKSIDAFLQLNPNFAEVGKIGIIYAISRAESISRFGEEASKAENNDWYSWLFNEFVAKHLQNPDIEKVLSEIPIRFVTFNYDRSIEHFLFTAITHSLPAKTIKEKFLPNISNFDFLNVRHMYGKLAHLPWQSAAPPRTTSEKYDRLVAQHDLNPPLEYGQIPTDNVTKYAQNINLIGERLQQDRADIANLFRWADRVFILGFGYAQENLDALNILENLRPEQNIFGTASGFIDNEISNIHETLSRCRPNGDGKTIIRDVPIHTALRMYLK